MGAGFIYFIIVGLWVAYFLPRWINSHEERAGKSVDKYQALLNVVGRTATGNDSLRKDPKKLEQEIQNRKITYLALISLLVATAFLSAVGLLSPLLISFPIISITGYIFVVRRNISQNRIEEKQEMRRDRASESRQPSLYRSQYAELITRVRSSERVEEWTPLAEREDLQNNIQLNGSSGIVLLPRGSAPSRGEWDPTPIPTPQYLTSARVVQTRRVIDLTKPGTWSTSQHEQMNEDLEALTAAAQAAIAPDPDEIFDQEVAEIAAEQIDRLRKAN
jgi:hypothetical protein